MRLTDEQIRETIEYAKTRHTGCVPAEMDTLARLALANHGPARVAVYAMWRQMQKEVAHA